MLKKIVLFTVILLSLPLCFSVVFAEQNGNTCWCNTDQYGCWITNDDGSTMYLMFWSEYARQYIMGSHSDPYEMVVTFPGYYGIYKIPCGSPAPAVVSASKPMKQNTNDPDSPTQDPYTVCFNQCVNSKMEKWEKEHEHDCDAYINDVAMTACQLSLDGDRQVNYSVITTILCVDMCENVK